MGIRRALDADVNLFDCDEAHIVVTNIHRLAERADRWLPAFGDGFVDLIIVDEGHHNAAPSWLRRVQAVPRCARPTAATSWLPQNRPAAWLS
jgi:DNA repair protein RadD